jgi:tetratricopeptide (TPR) repeat protein
VAGLTRELFSTSLFTIRYRPLVVALSLAALAAGGCSKAPPTKDEILARANEDFAAQRYDKAEKTYRELLRLAPSDPEAVRRLAHIYYDQGQLPQAYELLKRAAEHEPGDIEVQIELAQTSLTVGDIQRAHDAAVAVLDKRPRDEQALVVLANAATPDDAGDTRKLIEDLQAKDQDRAGYHLALGALALRQQEIARAETEFGAAVKLDPKSAIAHIAVADLAWRRDDIKAADEAFKIAADLSPLRSPMRLRYADFKLRTGAPADAKRILEEVTAKYPDYLPARVFSMKIACTEHQDEDCAVRVQNILAQDPVNYDAVFQDGLLNLAKGGTTKAIRDFEYLSNTYPQDPEVRYHLARAHLLSAKDQNPNNARVAADAAESSLNEAIRLAPNYGPAVLLYAELKIRKGSPAAATDALLELLKQQPQSKQANYLLATAYLAQQLREPALRILRQMTELFPTDPQPWHLIGTVLLTQNQSAEARKAFEKSAEVAPDFLGATEQVVNLDITDKQYAAALDRVQKQIDRDPKIAQPWALRGKIHLAHLDFARAEADLLKAIEIDPQIEPAYLLLAQLYVATNKQNEAIAKLTAFVQQRKDVSALMELGAIQQELKNYPAARDAYEQLLTISPNSLWALNNLAVFYSEQFGDIGKALDFANKARDLAPNVPAIADTLGWILFKKGDYGSALPLLQEAAVKLSNLGEVEFHLGIAYYMVGQEEPARVALQKAVSAGGEFLGKEEARARLALLAIDPRTADAGARADLEKFLRGRPNDPAALARLAALAERDGKSDEAIKTYEKIVAENPLYAPAVRQLALLYAELPADIDTTKPYDLAVKAFEAYPGDPELTKTLGILTYRRKVYPRALRLLADASAKRKDDAEILYYLGETYYQLKDWNGCKATLEQAATLRVPASLADEAKRTLAECTGNIPAQP